MRLFIGINIPESIKRRIIAAQKDLERYVNGKLVEPENLHISLKFIGEIEDGKAEEIKRVLSTITFKKFSAKLVGIGIFPGGDRVNSIWLKVESDELNRLVKEINFKLEAVGLLPDKRAFTGHLTLMRVKTVKNNKGLLTKLKELEGEEFGTVLVESFSLFNSILTSKYPKYIVLKEVKLNEG